MLINIVFNLVTYNVMLMYFRTSIDSFNKSISSPLVSPLTMIHEEEILATPEEEGQEEGDGIAESQKGPRYHPTSPQPLPKLNKESFTRPSAAGDVNRSLSMKEVPSSVTLSGADKKETLHSVATISTFDKDGIISSTPAAKDEEKINPLDQLPHPSPLLAGSSTPPPSSVGQIRAVLTAFPRAFLDTHSAEEATVAAAHIPIENPEVYEASQHSLPSTESIQPCLPASTDFQREFVRTCVAEAVEDQCEAMRMHLWRVQLDVAKALERQKHDLHTLLEARDAANARLTEECQRLREENAKLRKYVL